MQLLTINSPSYMLMHAVLFLVLCPYLYGISVTVCQYVCTSVHDHKTLLHLSSYSCWEGELQVPSRLTDMECEGIETPQGCVLLV